MPFSTRQKGEKRRRSTRCSIVFPTNYLIEFNGCSKCNCHRPPNVNNCKTLIFLTLLVSRLEIVMERKYHNNFLPSKNRWDRICRINFFFFFFYCRCDIKTETVFSVFAQSCYLEKRGVPLGTENIDLPHFWQTWIGKERKNIRIKWHLPFPIHMRFVSIRQLQVVNSRRTKYPISKAQ